MYRFNIGRCMIHSEGKAAGSRDRFFLRDKVSLRLLRFHSGASIKGPSDKLECDSKDTSGNQSAHGHTHTHSHARRGGAQYADTHWWENPAQHLFSGTVVSVEPHLFFPKLNLPFFLSFFLFLILALDFHEATGFIRSVFLLSSLLLILLNATDPTPITRK